MLELDGEAEPGPAQRKRGRIRKAPCKSLLEKVDLTLTQLRSYGLMSHLVVVFLYLQNIYML